MSHTSGTATDYLDLLDKLDTYLTATGHAWGKAFTGAGDGDLVDYIGTAASVAETFTITFTDATNFTVEGSTTGVLAAGVVDTPYSSAVIEFTIEAGATPFEAGDVFTIQTSPAWTRGREVGCADNNFRTSNLTNLESLMDNTNSLASRDNINQLDDDLCYVEFEMHRPTEVRQMLMRIGSPTYAPPYFKISYRDDPLDPWTLAEQWNKSWTQNLESEYFDIDPAVGAHKYWRFDAFVLTSHNGRVELAEMQLFEKPFDGYQLGQRFEIIWTAPGLDGAQEINIGARTYGSNNTDTYNLNFTAWRVTDPTAAVQSQPNAAGIKTLSLLNSPIGYWFVVNGQRLVVVTKFASLYQFAYLGYGNPYETPSQHPWPVLAGASVGSITRRYNSTTADFRFPADPGLGCLAAFYPDGQWREHANRELSGTSTEGNAGEYDQQVWPTMMNNDGEGQPSEIRENVGGSRPLLPLILWSWRNPAHTWGEFDGVYWTTGFNTVAEAIIREGLFDHLVLNNIFRNSTQHYAAVRLD